MSTTKEHPDTSGSPLVSERLFECLGGLEYRPVDADKTVTRPVTAWPLDHEALLNSGPIRAPAFYKGQWSKPGWYWMASLGRHISYESKFERSFLMEADFAGTVTGVVPQPFRLHFERDTAPHRHIPDYLVAHEEDIPELVDVKGLRAREKPLNRLTFALTECACDQLELRFTVYSEPDPDWQENLAFLAGFRNPLFARVDEHLPLLVDVLADAPLPFDEACRRLVSAGVDMGVAAATVWRAAWRRVVQVPLRSGLLNDDVLVEVARPEPTEGLLNHEMRSAA
ncbi:MAG: TnsA-like heteromeric transposase endonuclease subunit [Actinobacteria bacterium]|nr:TnsA-like heteromeric transposase endonuclease subunit [Actinomycetota bacterium]